jgi:hypothetical protein
MEVGVAAIKAHQSVVLAKLEGVVVVEEAQAHI